MSKKYSSVLGAIKGMSKDREFASNLEQEISNRTLSKSLFAMRCGAGFTQKQLAERMKCSQSRVSKLEVSPDRAIKVCDLIDYAEACKLDVTIGFHKPMTLVDSVKYHAFEIKKNLDHLAELAHRDPDIDKGVKGFFPEVLLNLLKIISTSAEQLPNKGVVKSQRFTVSHPSEVFEMDDRTTEKVT